MSTNSPGMERPKTECPFCRNVWQEHTMNQMEECMAIIKLDISARDAALQGTAARLKDRVLAQQILAHVSAKRKEARPRPLPPKGYA